MTRCPKTARPHQFRGRAKYRFAGVTLQCVLEEGHTGPCGMEPVPTTEGSAYATACPFPTAVQVPAPLPFTPQTPEQIAAGDERYREHLRRKRRG